MPGSCRIRSRLRRAALIAACATVTAVLPASLQAQTLFDSLLQALGGRTAATAAPVATSQADPRAWDFLEPRGESSSSAPAGPRTSYCVRLCDGSYFPLPRRAAAVKMSDAQICSAMCPAAETRVFSGSAIERAVASDGKPYTAMTTAFRFREAKVDNCTCTNRDAGGVASLDPLRDPTLRKGDIVVTRDGPVVFTGDRRGQDRAEAFVPAANYAGLPMSVRRDLADMRIATDANETAALPAGATLASNPVAVEMLTDRGDAGEPTRTPVAEAFASFAQRD